MPEDIAITLTLRGLGRSLPTLNISALSQERPLILGVGSLGCALARSLLSYGISNMTLVDSGLVRPSNPHRQCLFTTADIGKPKASTASAALSSISPSVQVTSLHLYIPTPGKGCPTMEDLTTLLNLIKASTVVFMCTDTRESRFIPSILCTHFNVPAISVGLGLDHYIVVRHGVTLTGEDTSVGGCYFCIDSDAPSPTYQGPPLDTCASTKPPLAPIAANTAADLLVTVVSSPSTFSTPSELSSSLPGLGPCYGILRHNVTNHTIHLGLNTAGESCKACGASVQREFEAGGMEWLLELACASAPPPPTYPPSPISDGGGGRGGASASASELVDNLDWLAL